jgi:hypothetical protein
VVMTIGVQQDLQRHSEITSCLPRICAPLHQPSRSRVSQSMRRYSGTKPRQSNGAFECRFDRSHWLTVELNEVFRLRINANAASG